MSTAASVRFKVALKLAVQRVRSLCQKKESMNKAERRDIASMLEKGKEERARIRVETIINEEIYIEMLEVLELFCELCLARFGLIEASREVDEGIKEAVAGILYASPKTDIKELHTIASLFLQHYGRDFAMACIENTDDIVPKRLTDKLRVETPSTELVDLYLFEIAKAYSVNWRPASMKESSQEILGAPPKDMSDIPLEDREIVGELPQTPPVDPSKTATTVSIHQVQPPPSKLIDNPSTSSLKTPAKAKEDADFDALQKRFEALKKR